MQFIIQNALALLDKVKDIDFEVLESSVLTVGFSLYFISMLGLAFEDYLKLIKSIKDKIGTKKNTIKKEDSKFEKHLRIILSASDIIKYISPKQFKFILISIFMVSLIVTVKVFDKTLIGTAFLLSLILSSLPYLIIRVKLKRISNKASHEAETLVNELILKYKLKDENIIYAIDALLENAELKFTKPILGRLLIKIRTTQNKDVIKEAVEVFNYSIGTTWGNMLGYNIYHACIGKVNISVALEDLSTNLKVARGLWQEQVKNTAEPRRMIWLSPIVSLILMYFAVFKSGLTIPELLYNQFQTTQGLTLFILILISLGTSIISVMLLFSKKFDI